MILRDNAPDSFKINSLGMEELGTDLTDDIESEWMVPPLYRIVAG